jgi:hypothetical protein
MGSKQFWISTGERVVRTFVQTVLGVFVGTSVTLGNAHWGLILDAAGSAAFISLLTSLAAVPVTGSASFLVGPKPRAVVRTKVVKAPVGKHEG